MAADTMLYSHSAEEQVLGAFLTDPRWMSEAVDPTFGPVTAEDFYIVRHQWVFEAIQLLVARQDPVEVHTVLEALRQAGHSDADIAAEQPSALYFLNRLTGQAPIAAYVPGLVAVVKHDGYRRLLLDQARALAGLATNRTVAPGALWGETSRLMLALKPAQIHSTLLRGTETLNFYDDMRLLRDQDNRTLFKLPLESLRRSIPVLDAETFGVVSAFSGIGKTAFLETWAEYLARLKKQVMFVHCELTTQKMLDRRMARHSGVPFNRLILPLKEQTREEIRRQNEAQIRIDVWKDHIDFWYTDGAKYEQVMIELQKFIDEGTEFIFIDYFQRIINVMDVDRNNALIDGLRRIAETNGVPIIMGSQLKSTLHGDRPYASQFLHDASSLHIQIVREKLDFDYPYQSASGPVVIKAGKSSPEIKFVIMKSSNSGTDTALGFLDGPCYAVRDMVTADDIIARGGNGSTPAPQALDLKPY